MRLRRMVVAGSITVPLVAWLAATLILMHVRTEYPGLFISQFGGKILGFALLFSLPALVALLTDAIAGMFMRRGERIERVLKFIGTGIVALVLLLLPYLLFFLGLGYPLPESVRAAREVGIACFFPVCCGAVVSSMVPPPSVTRAAFTMLAVAVAAVAVVATVRAVSPYLRIVSIAPYPFPVVAALISETAGSSLFAFGGTVVRIETDRNLDGAIDCRRQVLVYGSTEMSAEELTPLGCDE